MATVTHKKVAVGQDNPHAEVNKGEWNDTHDVVMAPLDMGIYIGTSEPSLKTYAQWLSSRTGYWAWIDISGEAQPEGVTAIVMAANATGSINSLIAGYARYVTAVINPANAVGSIAALVSTVTEAGSVSAEVMPANATGMVYALTAAYARYVAASVNPALATGTINKLVASYARYVTAAVGTANAAGAINALVATVTEAGFTAFTDSFTGSNGAALSSTHWVANANATIQSNQARINGGYTVVGAESITLQTTHSLAAKLSVQDTSSINGDNSMFLGLQAEGSVGTNHNQVLVAIDVYCGDWDGDVGECNATTISAYLFSYDNAGSATTHGSAACSQGDILEIRFSGADQINLYKNGSKVGGPYTTTATLGSTVLVKLWSAQLAYGYADDLVLQVL